MPVSNQTGHFEYGAEGRECGDCTVCCFTGAVDGLKPAHSKCPHECDGCAIYEDPRRPRICSEFRCAWLRGLGREDHRPDRSGCLIAVTSMNGGLWTFVIEIRPNGFEDSQDMILEMVRKFDVPAILVRHDRKPPHDTGDYTVIRDDLLQRTSRMRGDLMKMIANDVGIYDLWQPSP